MNFDRIVCHDVQCPSVLKERFAVLNDRANRNGSRFVDLDWK